MDLDGDGRNDILVGHGNGSFVTVVPGKGDGSFGEPRHYAAGGPQGSLAIADLDGDGLRDVVQASGDSYRNQVSVLVNRHPVALSFDDKETLRWPILVDTVSYDIYRGELSDLVDLDKDGVPDGGYGACRNELDPDTTDAMFVDAETPLAGEGFFYLMARVPLAGEVTLGSASNGEPRIPSQPCAVRQTPVP